MFDQAVGVDHDVELLLVASPGVDLGDSRDLHHLRAHDPVVERAELPWRQRVALDDVLEYLAETGRDRPERGPADVRGQLQGAEPFAHHLAGQVDVGVVVEGGRDLRQSELRNGAHLRQARESADGLFDDRGDLPLNLQRRQRRSGRVDADLHRSRVRERVEGQLPEAGNTDYRQQRRSDEHDGSTPQAEIDELGEHGYFASMASTSQHPAPMLSGESSVLSR